MIIPSEYNFTVDCIGEKTGTVYQGDFLYRFADNRADNKIRQEILKLDREYTQIYKELDPSVAGFNELIATLKYCMVECPAWFVDSYYGRDLKDEAPIYLIIEELKKFKLIREEALKG